MGSKRIGLARIEALIENLKRDLTLGGTQISGDKMLVVAKDDSFAISMPADTGKLFTTTGATGAVTATLPAPATTLKGTYCRVFNTVDQNLVIAVTGNDTLITLNDVAADTVTFSTSSEKIGAAVLCVCDGTKWLVMDASENSITSTIGT